MINGVVITGASTGIGAACALHLDALGLRVFAGIRNAADGEALHAQASSRLVPVHIDVTDSASIAAAVDTIQSLVGDAGLGGLVNNAGIAVGGPLEMLPLDELRRQFEVNVIGQLAVTQAFLPLLRKARGRIVNIGSIAGRVPLPLIGPYSMSKFALNAMTKSLRLEVDAWGIKVAIVEPGAIATPIWKKSTAAADALYPDQNDALYREHFACVRQMITEAERARDSRRSGCQSRRACIDCAAAADTLSGRHRCQSARTAQCVVAAACAGCAAPLVSQASEAALSG